MEDIIIKNIENYTQEIINGDLILTPKQYYITLDEFDITCFTKSTILYCEIKNNYDIITNKQKYRSILTAIWKSMPTQKILQYTTFNFKLTDEKGINGYNWCSKLNMSFQNKDANNTISEIMKMIQLNNYTIQLKIKLNTERIIYYKNYNIECYK